MEKFKLQFEKPVHGWLPIKFDYQGYSLDLDVSDVPNNPVGSLSEALIKLTIPNCKSFGLQEVIFHLEPVCYYFLFERDEDQIKVLIHKSNEYDGQRQLVKKLVGTHNEIILPLYRSLMNFYSYQYKEPHWPETDAVLIKDLKKRFKR